jgi:hypothetical protein
MVEAGERVDDARVWAAPGDPRTISELVRDGRALFLFYLFDWSST